MSDRELYEEGLLMDLEKANYRIKGLKELLWAAENDANEAEAYAEELEDDLKHQTNLIEQFFALLDKTEETDDGRVFHPTTIQSCRVLDAEKLEKILLELKATVWDTVKIRPPTSSGV